MGKVIITPEELAKSAHKYRKELLVMAVIALQSSLQHMTLRTGVRYKETVGELSGGLELGPYSETRTDNSDVNVDGRTLETFLGSVIKKFSPNSVYKSLPVAWRRSHRHYGYHHGSIRHRLYAGSFLHRHH